MKKRLITVLLLVSTISLFGCEQNEPSKPVAVEKPTPVVSTPLVQPTKNTARAGRVIYELHCAGCHDAGLGHAATMKLKLARAEGMAVLVQRTDLTSAYINHVVRDGLLEMPPFRPTDINDEELENLSQYIIDSGTIDNGKAYQQQEKNNE
ncbi:MAG: c-type cytochrome [Cycloclasticus sp.]